MYTDQEISHLIEYNTSKFFLNLGLLNGDEVCNTPEIKYIFTKNWQSRVFMANFSGPSAYSRVIQVISRIKKLNIPVLWFISPMSLPKNLSSILEDHGFCYRNEWKAMAIDLENVHESFDLPEGIEIKEVSNIDELKIWTDILVKSFEFPEIAVSYKKYFIKAGLKDTDSHYYLGFLNGKPVSSSVLFDGEGAAGLFYIGTIHEARKQGIAKVMVCYLLSTAKKKGYSLSVLQASEMGYPVYKKIGFKKYYTTKIYNR